MTKEEVFLGISILPLLKEPLELTNELSVSSPTPTSLPWLGQRITYVWKLIGVWVGKGDLALG